MAGLDSHSDNPILTANSPADRTSPVNHRPTIAGYRIAGSLGTGGMGTVYRALQISTNREVALKVLRADFTRSMRSRALFAQEVRLSARLQHPNVVRIYDSGIDCGLYYYAMELVVGETLDQYALVPHYAPTGEVTRSPLLPQAEILELMRRVCQGVQQAHLRGVIHRDIKPRNIMVSPDGQPHVLDFGLATMALQQRIDDDDSEEESQAVPAVPDPDATKDFSGTPAFMSPEQTRGRSDELDIRTDVYSLGVTLYLLLTGQMPRESGGSQETVMRKIAHEPITNVRAAGKKIDRELEALLLKALAPDRENRYASAGAMADDLDRYLKHQPLAAVRSTPTYVVRKWVGRHRRPVAIAGGVMLALIGLGGYSYHSHKAMQSAQAERADYDQTLEQLLARLSPQVSGRQISNRDLLNASADDAARIFRDNPAKLAGLLDRIGMTLSDQGWCRDGEARIEQAREMQVRSSGEENLDSIRMINDLAEVKREVEKFPESAALSQRAIALADKVPGSDDQALRAKIEWAHALDDLGQSDAAVAVATDAVELCRTRHPMDPGHPDILRARDTLAFALRDQGRFSEALQLAEQVLNARTDSLGETHPDTIRSMDVYASILCVAHKTDEARLWIDRAVKFSASTLGLAHSDRLTFLCDQGTILAMQGDYREAVTSLRNALANSVQLLGDDNQITVTIKWNLAKVLGDWVYQPEALPPAQRDQCRQEAETLLKQVIETRNEPAGTDGMFLLTCKDALAAAETGRNELTDAEKLYAYTLQIRQQRYAADDPALLPSIRNLARVLEYQKKWPAAEPLYRRVWQMLSKMEGPQSPAAMTALEDLNRSLQKQGKAPLTGNSNDETRMTNQ